MQPDPDPTDLEIKMSPYAHKMTIWEYFELFDPPPSVMARAGIDRHKRLGHDYVATFGCETSHPRRGFIDLYSSYRNIAFSSRGKGRLKILMKGGRDVNKVWSR